MPNCKTVAVCNQKGGVGKTTTTVNLGVGLAMQGKKVLLVDADPQGDLTTCLGWQDADNLPIALPDKMVEVMQDNCKDPTELAENPAEVEFLCCCETHSTLNASHRLPSQARASRTNIAYNTNRNRYASAFAVGVHSRYSAMNLRKEEKPMSNCKTIAVCNQKGGTGKTTTTVNLGIGLARLGKKVLLVDADPQGDLTTCLGWQDNDSLQTTITDKFSEIMREENANPRFGILKHEEGVDLLPSNLELSAMEMMLVTTMSRETVMRNYLSKVKADYDYQRLVGAAQQIHCYMPLFLRSVLAV